jgi:hypothetical protein
VQSTLDKEICAPFLLTACAGTQYNSKRLTVDMPAILCNPGKKAPTWTPETIKLPIQLREIGNLNSSLRAKPWLPPQLSQGTTGTKPAQKNGSHREQYHCGND